MAVGGGEARVHGKVVKLLSDGSFTQTNQEVRKI